MPSTIIEIRWLVTFQIKGRHIFEHICQEQSNIKKQH